MSDKGIEVDAESFKKILNYESIGIEKVLNVEEEDAVKEGENYGSVMKRLKTTCIDKTGNTIQTNVIMKKAKLSTEAIELPIFNCEIQIYTEVLPKFEDIINSGGEKVKSKLSILWPICHGVRNYDVILLEDLVEKGYTMRNRRIPLDKETALLVIEKLGRFHALSVVAVNRKILDPNTLGPFIYGMKVPVLMNIITGGFLTLADSIESDPQWKSVVKNLRSLATTIGTDLEKMVENIKGIFPVMNHGDCWSNNILFHFLNEKATALRFVDYQACHYSCFALDLVYLMHTSMSAQIRQPCYKELVESYRNSLIETIEMLNENIKVPDLNTMLQIMDKVSLFGMVAAFTLFPITINTMEKPWDFEKAISNESINSHSREMYENKNFKDSFKLDIIKFKSQGLL